MFIIYHVRVNLIIILTKAGSLEYIALVVVSLCFFFLRDCCRCRLSPFLLSARCDYVGETSHFRIGTLCNEFLPFYTSVFFSPVLSGHPDHATNQLIPIMSKRVWSQFDWAVGL